MTPASRTGHRAALELNADRPTSGLPIVSAVALILVLVSIIPVYLAQRLAGAGPAATR